MRNDGQEIEIVSFEIHEPVEAQYRPDDKKTSEKKKKLLSNSSKLSIVIIASIFFVLIIAATIPRMSNKQNGDVQTNTASGESATNQTCRNDKEITTTERSKFKIRKNDIIVKPICKRNKNLHFNGKNYNVHAIELDEEGWDSFCNVLTPGYCRYNENLSIPGSRTMIKIAFFVEIDHKNSLRLSWFEVFMVFEGSTVKNSLTENCMKKRHSCASDIFNNIFENENNKFTYVHKGEDKFFEFFQSKNKIDECQFEITSAGYLGIGMQEKSKTFDDLTFEPQEYVSTQDELEKQKGFNIRKMLDSSASLIGITIIIGLIFIIIICASVLPLMLKKQEDVVSSELSLMLKKQEDVVSSELSVEPVCLNDKEPSANNISRYEMRDIDVGLKALCSQNKKIQFNGKDYKLHAIELDDAGWSNFNNILTTGYCKYENEFPVENLRAMIKVAFFNEELDKSHYFEVFMVCERVSVINSLSKNCKLRHHKCGSDIFNNIFRNEENKFTYFHTGTDHFFNYFSTKNETDNCQFEILATGFVGTS